MTREVTSIINVFLQLLDFEEFQMFAIAAIEEEEGHKRTRGDWWDPMNWPWLFRPIVRYDTFGDMFVYQLLYILSGSREGGSFIDFCMQCYDSISRSTLRSKVIMHDKSICCSNGGDEAQW